MQNNYFIYIPFVPSNYDYLDTVNDEHFYVKNFIEDSFKIDLYKNSAEENRVDKTNYLELVGSLDGLLRDSSSIINLYISIEQIEVPEFNYIYIQALNRYYYVTDIESIRYGLWGISLTIDVLMSYKESLLNLNAFIDRNQFTFNQNIIDEKRVIEQGIDIEDISISNNVFDNDICYVINGLAIRNYE